ncbi:4Fe-4S cluster-binding domain-containing protein [Planctomycetota bacterium]
MDGSVDVKFTHARQRRVVSLADVKTRIVEFLEHCCDVPFVEPGFLSRVPGATGEERFASLLTQAGFGDRTESFLRDLVAKLEPVSRGDGGAISIGGVLLPYHLLLAVLEVLIPGTDYKTIRKVRQLEEHSNFRIPEDEREEMQRVLDLYPVRLSMHTIRQMRLSPHVAYQYHPFLGELEEEGQVHTWVGQFHRGLVEQMYQNRVIFIMNMACPTYCRFCFRKHKECRNQKSPTKPHVKQAVLYIQHAPAVKEIVLTGGDPFMNRATLQYAVQELGKIPHVQTLRLASRAVSYFPELFLRDDSYWLNYLVRTNLELTQKGKRLELATHFVHPDEISVDALFVIAHLVRHGVPVYVQTPFINGCNDSGREMVELFHTLRGAGAEIHYIFMPTSPIQGNRIYWSAIAAGLDTARFLRRHVSDRAMPHVTTATTIGKIDWNSSGWAVERSDADPRYIWIRTPYTSDYFDEFAPILQLGDAVRRNPEGTLDAAFMAEVGDDSLFAGHRARTVFPEALEQKRLRTTETVATSLSVLQSRFLEDQRELNGIVGAAPVQALARLHRTRVELDAGARQHELEAALAFLEAHSEIVDVVVSRRNDVLSGFSHTLELVQQLHRIPHVLSIRLRSLDLNYTPQAFSRPVIDGLASLNRLRAVRPTRLEIETRFLHASELRPEHARVVRELRLRGITVYNNTPLLTDVNDNPEDTLGISSACRELGIEFCNVYVAGLPIQESWNVELPLELSGVVDIASHVRRHGSGREVPRYLLRTSLGEVVFAIVPRIFVPQDDGSLRVRMVGYDLEYFQDLAADFQWPVGVSLDDDGTPLVAVPGVSLEIREFLVGSLGGPELDGAAAAPQ